MCDPVLHMSRRILLLLCLVSFSLVAQRRVPVTTAKAMVVSEEPLATEAGVAVLRAGGNAVDAAVAVALTLAVTHPVAGNLGGGGFLLVRMADGREAFFDFREMAPQSASRDMYLDAKGALTRDSLEGPRASGVPGSVKGLELAHQRFGRTKWADVVAPAARLAREGFPVSATLASSLSGARNLPKFPESKRIFQRDGKFYAMGETFRQPELAATLTRLAQLGSQDFYEGETARHIADFMAKQGGTITLADLKAYRAVERKPLAATYRGHRILTAPPPSSGGIGLQQMLGMLEGSGYEKGGAGSASTLHYLAEVQKRFYADRSEFLADPGYYAVPSAKLLDPAYIAARRATIGASATPSDQIKPASGAVWRESTETTHLSVLDADGNAVSLTTTLNGGYGSGVTIPGAGFLMNNEMDDFAAKPGSPNLFGLVQGEANRIEPGKRPLSSMTPTILLRDDKVRLILGAPGGGRIITGVLQVLLNVLDFNMNIAEAVQQPRIHHQWQPDTLFVENGISPDTDAALRRLGHQTRFPGGGVALVNGILVEPSGITGAADPRSAGRAAGY
jgi:gamma-glutamyltranspeptidase/glutathione hydrolase